VAAERAGHIKGLEGRQRRMFPFREFAPRLYGLLLRRLGNPADADDLVQETYLRFLRVGEDKLIEQPEAYLFRIATNLVHEHALHQRRELTLVDDEERPLAGPDDTGFDKRMERRLELSRLSEVLAELPPLQGQILLLSKRDGYTRDEIAKRLDLSPHTVKKYLTRAIATCRIRMAELDQ
jgi:RNA polymerase sigma-19 factor, ECF subfamily